MSLLNYLLIGSAPPSRRVWGITLYSPTALSPFCRVRPWLNLGTSMSHPLKMGWNDFLGSHDQHTPMYVWVYYQIPWYISLSFEGLFKMQSTWYIHKGSAGQPVQQSCSMPKAEWLSSGQGCPVWVTSPLCPHLSGAISRAAGQVEMWREVGGCKTSLHTFPLALPLVHIDPWPPFCLRRSP